MSNESELKNGLDELNNKLADLAKSVAIEVFNQVIIQTPVDTGRMRGNWQATMNTPARAEVNEASAKNRQEDVETKINQMKLNDVVYLSNNLPYAEALEYGWSGQRPNGWVRTTVGEGQRVLNSKTKEIK